MIGTRGRRAGIAGWIAGLGLLAATAAAGAEPASFDALASEFRATIRPAVRTYCLECHSTDAAEGDLDLERFVQLDDVRRAAKTWQKVAEMLGHGEMPPKDARRLPPAQRAALLGWVDRYLRAEAHAQAGDPGPVVLRRLNNAEYTYTVRDLTGLDLDPAREFPADNAAGEGFTNAGAALVMSPALMTKYLDAAKGIAAHAELLRDGIRFSGGTTRRDWTDESLARIRAFYSRFADAEGRLPLEPYLAASLAERDALAAGTSTPAAVSQRYQLNARYFDTLWRVLNDPQPSLVLDTLRAHWRQTRPGDAAALTAEFERWQKTLTRFQKVGHMKPRVVPVNPVTSRQEVRFKFPEGGDGRDVTLYLGAGDAGDGQGRAVVVWERPRIVLAGRPDLPLRDLRGEARELVEWRTRVFAAAARCLDAAAEASARGGPVDGDGLARRYGVEPDVLSAWLDYLGLGPDAGVRPELFTNRMTRAGGYDFVKGWGSPETPSLLANSSGQSVRIPGKMKAHGVVVHPSPTRSAAVGWQSPIAAVVRVEGAVTHAHPECGNGVAWRVELRRGATRQTIAIGTSARSTPVTFESRDPLAVQPGDLISLLIGPRDGSHACDLTDIELKVRTLGVPGPAWDLAGEVASDVLAGNPHADRYGNPAVWSFYSEPIQGAEGSPVPTGSLLAKWMTCPEGPLRHALAEQVQRLLREGPPAVQTHPDAVLYRQLNRLGGSLVAGSRSRSKTPAARSDRAGTSPGGPLWGLDPARFGRLPDGIAIGFEDLAVQVPSVVEVRLPADLVAGCELVATAVVHPDPGTSPGTAQVVVGTEAPGSLRGLRGDVPVLVSDGPNGRARIERSFDDFRRWFPASLCYPKIVPVDEVVTLTLFHREDEPLQRLMLDDAERTQIDRLWDELHFVSEDALTLVDAYAQLMEYATQDGDPRLLEPYRKPIHDRAAAFRRERIEAEPRQVEAVVALAARAYRRPLTEAEAGDLRGLYRTLRGREIPHDEAVRLVLARLLVAPEFLYRVEKAGPGTTPSPVSDWELASRLSYFLWSSMPDDPLRELASAGRLRDPEVLAAEARRMLSDDRIRRLANEFACQWLHVYDLETLDEKSERHFPTFAGLRGSMHEEVVRFFTDLFQHDRRVLSMLDADHTFLNEALARHYGIPGVTGAEWRRVDGLRAYGHGGILGLAATLARQSGASRTSPVLRGVWVSETLLGEALPKPPKDVPRLPEDEADSGALTVRQLVEKHRSDVRCAGCHARIDPFGFALEGFDAVGRRRDRDLGGRPIDTATRVFDGTELTGLDGLRQYLLTARRKEVVRQFSRKLLGYALGRAVQLSDEPLLERLEQQLGTNDGRFSAAVETIVRSRQFREIRGKDMVAADTP